MVAGELLLVLSQFFYTDITNNIFRSCLLYYPKKRLIEIFIGITVFQSDRLKEKLLKFASAKY